MKASPMLRFHWILAVVAVANATEECHSVCADLMDEASTSARSAVCGSFRDVVQRPQLGRVLNKCWWGFKAAIDTNCHDACMNGGQLEVYSSVERLGEVCPGALMGNQQSLLRDACVQGYHSGVEGLKSSAVGRRTEDDTTCVADLAAVWNDKPALTAEQAVPVIGIHSGEGDTAPHAANSSEAEGAAKGGERIMKHYRSFREFASDRFTNMNETLPVPVVTSRSWNGSIPLAMIIGVQKGGTQDLRNHLLTHPLLSGMRGDEAHFFDRQWYPTARSHRGEWAGSDRDGEQLSTYAVGSVLSAYSKKAMESVVPSARNITLTVDSTPCYIFHPLAPYRIKMVLPQAKFIVILRDPTERYYSQLRMCLCWTKSGETLEELEKRRYTYFHTPGEATSYLEQGQKNYVPNTPLCRGEDATLKDLQNCWRSMQKLNPLHRGLYADQLERWFRVFDRSQILILEASEVFVDFAGTLDKVSRHVGLPAHEFRYDSSFRHQSTCDSDRPDLFAAGGRYDRMLEDEQLFREWYRPHNQRLYELLGRTMPWE